VTKREREQVVELLRCAADIDELFDSIGIVCAGWWLGYVDFISHCERPYELAQEAVSSVLSNGQMEYSERLLEAAARVEEGTWP
jgi:hypothetical protein